MTVEGSPTKKIFCFSHFHVGGLALILPPLHGPDLPAVSQEKHTARSLRIRSNEEKQLTVLEHGRRKVRPQGCDRK